MKFRKSLLKDVKSNSIKREVTFILNDSNEELNRKMRREICHQFNQVNSNLNKRLDIISKLTDLIPVKLNVDFTSPTWPIYDNDISDVFDILYDTKNLRVLINFEDFDSNELNSILTKRDEISHLIEISFIEHSGKDLNTFKSSSSTLYVNSARKVIKVIEDIMLDISMYYSIFSEETINSLEFRNNFSYEKVNKIQKSNLVSQDWDISRNKGYVALAGYFWNNTTFDYINYIECWKQIGNDLGLKVTKTEFPSLNKQLKLHKDYGELPLKIIQKKFNELENGEYLLARLVKIPKRHKAQDTLLKIFGGSKIKRGKCIIIKKERAVLFDHFTQNISLFKIIKG